MSGRTVLVVGSGGREHALALKLLESPTVERVVVSPGNGGTESDGLESLIAEPMAAAAQVRPDLIVVGPEAPLCEGLVDELQAAGYLVYGPSREAAQLEASKAFMKAFCDRHGIATARHVTIDRLDALDAALAEFTSPPVVKASGLCAGKGVVVAESMDEARAAARSMLRGEAFGDAGAQVVLEERLAGQEVSIHAICDGEQALLLPAIQDHKRIGEGDIGPNTGGMGTYGPPPVATQALMARAEAEIVLPVLRGMRAEGTPFRGTLFAGLMVSDAGAAKLLEINVRFGDPETQVLMGLLDGDLFELLASAARGGLDSSTVSVRPGYGLCVVLAAHNYPADPRKGDVIDGLARAAEVPGVRVYHAGTTRSGDGVRTAGGRVLGVCATGPTLRGAREQAYLACGQITFAGMQYRRDIGHRAL